MGRARTLAGTAGQSLGMRNRIINGDMRIDQRNAGAAVTVNTAAPFPVDRWNAYSDLVNMTGQRSTVAPAGFTNSMVFTVATGASPTAGQISRVEQRIEGLNVSDLGWGTANAASVTVSFMVRSSVAGLHSGVVSNVAGNRSYPFTFTVTAANTWEYETITIPGDTTGTWVTDNTTGLKLMFNLGSGSTYLAAAGSWNGSAAFGATGSVQLCATSGATLYITGVQLEKGETATPFEFRPYGHELTLCQRYCLVDDNNSGPYTWFAHGYCVNATSAAFARFFPVTMRVSPSVTVSSTTSFLVDSVPGLTTTNLFNNGYGSTAQTRLVATVASGLTVGYGAALASDGASARRTITYSAEL